MITRAQIRRQLRKEGGIMNVVPRQGYFLGSIGRAIGKVVGKVGDVAKQVVKSPVGKAALLGAGIYGLGGGFGGQFGLGKIGPSIGRGLGALKSGLFGVQGIGGPAHGASRGILGKLGLTKGFGGGMTALGGITGASLLTYFMAKGKTEEEAEELAQDVYRGKGLGMDLIKADMKNYRSGALSASQAHDRGYHFLTPRNYLSAQGGRVGLKDGTEKIPSSKKQRGEDWGLGIYEAGHVQEETPGRDIVKDFPGVIHDMLASYLSKRKRGMPTDQIQTDLIQSYGLSNFSNFMTTLKEEGLGDYKYKSGGTDLGPREIIEETTQYPEMAIGGRVGLASGSPHSELPTFSEGVKQKYVSDEAGALPKSEGGVLPKDVGKLSIDDFDNIEDYRRYIKYLNKTKKAKGGRIGFGSGGPEDWDYDDRDIMEIMRDEYGTWDQHDADYYDNLSKLKKKKTEKKKKRAKAYGGGIGAVMPRIPMGMPRVNAGGVSELDYRQEGGYVPMGVKEKADDVPAMLSKNEFVMTADAVKGAGGGNVEKGAQKMYDTMKRLENRIA